MNVVKKEGKNKKCLDVKKKSKNAEYCAKDEKAEHN